MFDSHIPVAEDAFFDRDKELSHLEDAVEHLTRGSPKWIALLGPRKIGKTSLILEYARNNRRDDTVIVRVDVMEHAPLSGEVFRAYAVKVIDALIGPSLGASMVDAALRGEWARLVYRWAAQESISEPIAEAVASVPTVSLDAAGVAWLLDLPSRLAQELGRFILVVWDEFQELEGARLGRDLSRPFALLRSVWQTHKRVGYVISGSAPSMIRNLVTAPDSPFFQHFEILELSVLPRSDAFELIRAGSDGRISETMAAELVAAVGTHPFYLQVMGEALVRGDGPIDRTALKQAVQEQIFSSTGRLGLVFEREYTRLVGRSSFHAAILGAVAKAGASGLRVTDIGRAVGAPSGDTVRYIERLGDGLVRDDDGRYRIADRVFALWIEWRQPEGKAVPMRVVGDDAERGCAERLARLGFDLVYQSRASRGAFDLLALRGGRQMGVQVKRRRLPLAFGLDEWNRMRAEAERLSWKWIVAAVDREGTVRFLDPAHARVGKTARLHATAEIENLLAWTGR